MLFLVFKAQNNLLLGASPRQLKPENKTLQSRTVRMCSLSIQGDITELKGKSSSPLKTQSLKSHLPLVFK